MAELEEGTFRLQFFTFRKPLRNEIAFSLHNIKYVLLPGAHGALLLLYTADLSSPRVGSEIEELVNSYLSLKSNGVQFSLRAPED